jgi:hypothetical protein
MNATKENVMPYSIERKSFGKYNVINEHSGKVMGEHPTRRRALAQMRALYANEPGSVLTKRMLKPSNPELWEKAKTEAKAKFSVYPSAYANAWASRWYKERGGSWEKTDKRYVPEEKKPDEQKKSAPQKKSMPMNTFINASDQLESFEEYVKDKDKESDTKKEIDDTTQKANDKDKSFWLKEEWVDISRPVIDESGVVIGFHPCGRSTKEVRSSMEKYRTSYPRCVPKSKAMKMNAIEREMMIRRSRKHEMPEEEQPSRQPAAHEHQSED